MLRRIARRLLRKRSLELTAKRPEGALHYVWSKAKRVILAFRRKP